MRKERFRKRYRVVAAAVLSVAVVSLLVSCGDDEEPTGPTTPTFTYPHANGSQWIHNYEGSSAVKYVLSGVFNHPAAGETYQLFSYTVVGGQWQQHDVLYLKVTEADVRVYLDETSSDFHMFLKFPLKVGNQWSAGVGYTATVTSKEKISVPAGSFNCFKIDYVSEAGNFTFWWPSKVGGMGAKNHGYWYIGSEPITLELASYNLPT